MDARQDQFTKGTESLPNGETRRSYHEQRQSSTYLRFAFMPKAPCTQSRTSVRVAPFDKNDLPSTARSDFSSQGAEYPSRRRLDQQAAAVDRQYNAVDVSVLHQE